nr:hypothetical protein [Tanacetum cinerariifolium]
MANLPPDHNEFALAVEAAPNNVNGWIEEEEKEEDPEMKEEEDLKMKEEEEEMEINDEMDDPKVINLYEIEEGELPPPPAESDTSSDTEPEVEAEAEAETEAANCWHYHPGTISCTPVIGLSKIDQYLGELNTDWRSKTRERNELKQSVSTLEDQMRGLMLEDREEKERLKKKLKVVQEEKEQVEQALRHVVVWICEHFGVEIPLSVDEERPTKANIDMTTLYDAQPSEPLSRIDAIGCDDLYRFVKQCNYVKDFNISANTQRFHELALLCLKMVSTERKKIEAYIQGLSDNIKGTTISSRPTSLNEAMRMAHALMVQKAQDRAERIVEGNKRRWESSQGNGVTRPKKYSVLSATEAIQADCDVKATNIILQGLPPESQQYSHTQSSTPLSYTYTPNDFQSSVHHNAYTSSSYIPQVEYAPSVNQQPKFSQPDSGLIVPVFQKGDDPIDAINYMMSFLTAVVTSRYPPTNNQLRNSSNPRQQATINNGRVTVQPIQGRHTSLAVGTSRTYTSGASENNSEKQRTVICYNCKGEGHMSKQCTKPKRKMDESWFKDKVLLV